ncbi:NUMOD1 domain-containing DNA-binding protein [Flectobacillus major]|uniref:NUMOD1 domain-containing DNA-binding protein n=1 Tax=Flectobacillus major TaxID=103 RepID=UPI0003FF4A9F|nr:NUMOD1 domain-containing DNA-binding protein [Flectobacillus major]
MEKKPRIISKSKALQLGDFSGYPFMNTSLVNLEGEEWIGIPQFDECFMVSNMGRVKALPRLIISVDGHKPYYTKERIFSQYITGTLNNHTNDYTFQLSVHIRYEGLSCILQVNRLVYDCFVKKLNYDTDKLKIIHKDGDNLNNKIANLEASNSTYIFYDQVKKERRSLKSKSVIVQKHSKAVIQYNLQGEVLNHFPSICAAAEATQLLRSNIKDVLKKKHIQLKGFVFRYETDPYQGENASFSKTKKVNQYTIEGTLLKTYNSVSGASYATGITADSISKCALLKSKFASGFVWRYEGDIYEGNFTRRALKVSVCQYTKSGEFIGKFPSITLAAKSLGLNDSSIRDCLKGQSKTCGGYVWRRENQPYEGEHKDFSKTKAVVKLDRSGNILDIFPSIVAAAETIGLTPDAIQKNVTGKNYTAGGFVWRYATAEESTAQPEYIAPKPTKVSITAIAVVQYTKDGTKVASYDSITEASEKTGIGMPTIRNFIDNPTHTYGSFIWRRKGDEYKGELENVIRENDAKIVTQYDLNGKKIKVFASVYVASKAMKYSSSWISQVASGKLKVAHGYIWQYGDGPEEIDIEAYRADTNLHIDKTRKTVSCYDLSGNKITSYNSITKASQEKLTTLNKVGAVVNGRTKSTQELIWIYGDGPDKIDTEVYFLNGEIRAI